MSQAAAGVQAVAAATLPVVEVEAAVVVVLTTKLLDRTGLQNQSDNEPVSCSGGRLFIGQRLRTLQGLPDCGEFFDGEGFGADLRRNSGRGEDFGYFL